MNAEKYYCDGLCELCDKGKLVETEDSVYYTCDEKKVKGLDIVTPLMPNTEQEVYKNEDLDR